MMAKLEKLSLEEVKKHLKDHPEWFLTDEEDKLVTALEFESFEEAAEFTVGISKLADELNHHPEVYIYDYKFMQILVSTHEVEGFSEKDIEFMESFDEVMSGAEEVEEEDMDDDGEEE